MKKNKPNETLAVSQPGPREAEQEKEPEYAVRFRGAIAVPAARGSASTHINEIQLPASQIFWPMPGGSESGSYGRPADGIPIGWLGLEIRGKVVLFPGDRIESVWPL